MPFIHLERVLIDINTRLTNNERFVQDLQISNQQILSRLVALETSQALQLLEQNITNQLLNLGSINQDLFERIVVLESSQAMAELQQRISAIELQHSKSTHEPAFSPEMFGLAGVGNDDTLYFDRMITELQAPENRGNASILLRAVNYIVPNGVRESIRGIKVRGSGQTDMGPNLAGDYGTWIHATNEAWCWLHENPNPPYSLYDGCSFEDVGFKGNENTIGGFWSQSNGNFFKNIKALYNKTGLGFKFGVNESGAGTDDASWNTMIGLMSQDNLVGYRWMTPDSGSQVIGCETIKTTRGGIGRTGVGMWVSAGNVTLLGGKNEGNEIGYLVDAHSGVTILGARAEGNTRGYVIERFAGWNHGSRISIIGCGSTNVAEMSLLIGQYNVGDRVIGFWTPQGKLRNDGTNTHWIASDGPTEGTGTLASTGGV